MKNMTKLLKWILVAVVFAFLTGCATPQAPRAETGEKIEMHLLSNRGDPDELTDKEYDFRNEVGEWMERNMLTQLRRSGYKTEKISSFEDFQPASGRYLLEMTIDRYNPGSAAARIIVGFGAGAAALDCSYGLYDKKDEPLLEWKDGAGTSGHWTRIPAKLNKNTVGRVTEYLREKKTE